MKGRATERDAGIPGVDVDNVDNANAGAAMPPKIRQIHFIGCGRSESARHFDPLVVPTYERHSE